MYKFNFNHIASQYDQWYETPLGYQVDIIEKKLFFQHLKKIKTRNILEIGSGTGHWTQWLSELDFVVTGIDIAEKMLQVAVRKNIPKADFIMQSADDLPFEDNSIENVVAITSLEFVENIDKAMKEIFRVLKPEGYFIVGALNKNGSLETIRKKDEIFKHATIFTKDDLFRQMKRFGNAVIDGCLYMPNPSASVDDILIAEKQTHSNLKNIYGNFLVGSVQKQKKQWK